MSTFFVSGLLHEYILAITSLKGGNTLYESNYFWQTAFFMLNAMWLVVEHLLAQNKTMQYIASKLPNPAKTVLVVMTALPAAHWFIDEFIANNLLKDFAVGYPLLVQLE